MPQRVKRRDRKAQQKQTEAKFADPQYLRDMLDRNEREREKRHAEWEKLQRQIDETLAEANKEAEGRPEKPVGMRRNPLLVTVPTLLSQKKE